MNCLVWAARVGENSPVLTGVLTCDPCEVWQLVWDILMEHPRRMFCVNIMPEFADIGVARVQSFFECLGRFLRGVRVVYCVYRSLKIVFFGFFGL
jgi:hypothetical protein